MRTKNLIRVDQVAAWRLCMGCGACASVCSNGAIALVDIASIGIRPDIDVSKCRMCGDCIKVCPGVGLVHERCRDGVIAELRPAWGPILELWEGYATEQQIRYAGSSGGVATALALYALESGIAAGVLQVGVDEENPIRSVPVYSTTKEQVQACSGSRYAPASPCESFGVVKGRDCRSVFVGKPCDVAALCKARKLDAGLDEKVAFTISIFCAGTPTTRGTLAILEQMGINGVAELASFRYRGNGWPGSTTAVEKSGVSHNMEYAQSWGDILSRHGQLRCRLCPDNTGEFADISCGDPWYRPISADEAGQSLVLARTARGREVLQDALRADYVTLKPAASAILPQSQQSLLSRRGHLWGRLLAMRVLRIPTPFYRGFSLLSQWRSLPARDKSRSILGTLKRIVARKLYKPFSGDQK